MASMSVKAHSPGTIFPTFALILSAMALTAAPSSIDGVLPFPVIPVASAVKAVAAGIDCLLRASSSCRACSHVRVRIALQALSAFNASSRLHRSRWTPAPQGLC